MVICVRNKIANSAWIMMGTTPPIHTAQSRRMVCVHPPHKDRSLPRHSAPTTTSALILTPRHANTPGTPHGKPFPLQALPRLRKLRSLLLRPRATAAGLLGIALDVELCEKDKKRNYVPGVHNDDPRRVALAPV